MNILCFFNFHRWKNYGFSKELHGFITKTYQECSRCGKKRMLKEK